MANTTTESKRAIKSTAADKAVDFGRAADMLTEAASLIARASNLMAYHGTRVSYAQSVAESVEAWAHDADRIHKQHLNTAAGR